MTAKSMSMPNASPQETFSEEWLRGKARKWDALENASELAVCLTRMTGMSVSGARGTNRRRQGTGVAI